MTRKGINMNGIYSQILDWRTNANNRRRKPSFKIIADRLFPKMNKWQKEYKYSFIH